MATYYKWCKKCKTKHYENVTQCPKCNSTLQLRSDDLLAGIFGVVQDKERK
jgi:RNA polymerase subunit RPABC4/transcription elongation factor Spt4